MAEEVRAHAARSGRWIGAVLWPLALGLAFGVFGLVALLPRVRERRRRRAARCEGCRRRYRWQAVLVLCLSIVVLGGAAFRAAQAAGLSHSCDAAWAGGNGGLLGPAGREPPTGWNLTRDLVTAPESGVALGYARSRGMTLCNIGDQRMTVAFLPRARIPGGSTVGDVFLTKTRWDLDQQQAQALAQHESRHVSQWTVLTLAGGPLALPVLYGTDSVFFPTSRNHFERLAGLRGGGYPKPSSFGPDPQPVGVAVLAAFLLLLGWRRLRWLSRWAWSGRRGVPARPGRCSLHTRGWLRPYGASSFVESAARTADSTNEHVR